jgi:predicted RNA-binding Zn-ribbon protein involved in translation (DUF1610 family)
MWYIIPVVLALLATGLVFGLGRKGPSTATNTVAPGERRLPDRSAIRARLQALAKTPAPTDLKPGAMCYETAASPDRAEYLCPACGEKTFYPSGQARHLSFALPRCRLLAARLATLLECRLDESTFCRRCTPDAAAPVLHLVIRYGTTEREHRAGVNGYSDLAVLIDFLEGKTVHRNAYDGEEALKEHIPLLERLLGVSARSD